jgi:hypothetical protein
MTRTQNFRVQGRQFIEVVPAGRFVGRSFLFWSVGRKIAKLARSIQELDFGL